MRGVKILRDALENLRSRIFALFLVFNILSVVLVTVMLYGASARILYDQTCDNMENNLNSVSYGLESGLTSINEMISDIALERSVIEDIQSNHPYGSYAYLLVNDRLREILNRPLRSNRLLKSVYLASGDFAYFCKSDITRTYSRDELLQTDWVQLFPESQETKWYFVSGTDNVVERSRDDMLVMVKKMYNKNYSRIVGYLSANVGFDELQQYLEQYQFSQSGYLILCNDEGQILYHSELSMRGELFDGFQALAERPEPAGTFRTRNMLITYQRSRDTGLMYIGYVPTKDIMVPASALQRIASLLILLIIVLSIIYAGIISKHIYAPIQVLSANMQVAASGDTSVRIREKRRDEMGGLYDNFNFMISRIEQLIQKLYQQEIMTKELQIKNLQIQLKPHFLYNVLDSIHWAARENNMDDVCAMIFLLSRYFQKTLDNGRDVSAVQDVAAAMESYLELQHIRYGDKLRYTIYVDPKVSKCRVPKYLFQPLLENAIMHGIEKRSTQGDCLVSWILEGDRLHFRVEDNGAGIDEERLRRIRQSLESSEIDSGEHFAFRNINTQLRLLYGPEYTLKITSSLGQGTCVEFDIPLGKEAEE